MEKSLESYPDDMLHRVAVAYIRVSTIDQSDNGGSVENQKTSIEEYARNKELLLSENLIMVEEKPASKHIGYTMDINNITDNFNNRPKLTEILKLAEKRKFKHLLVYSRDRLSRETQDSMALEIFFRNLDIEVHFIREGEGLNGLNKEIKGLLDIVFNSISEMEVNILSSRVWDGLKACIRRGKWTGGKAPFGYVLQKYRNEGEIKKKWVSNLTVSEFEGKIVRRVFELYSRGLGYQSIYRAMEKEFTFIRWTKSKVEGIIKNETYTGCIIWDRRGGRRHPGKRNKDPFRSDVNNSNVIIDKVEWYEIELERRIRSERKDNSYYNTRYILRDKILCPGCKQPMKARNPGDNRTCVYYCKDKDRGDKCKLNIPCDTAKKAFMDELRNGVFRNGDTDEIINELYIKLNKRIEERKTIIDNLDESIKYNNNKLQKIKECVDKVEDQEIIKALNLHYLIYRESKEKYEKTKEIFNKLMENDKKLIEEDQEGKTPIQDIISAFALILFNDADSENVLRIWREFIIKFVNYVDVSYDSKTKKVNINSIDFLPS